MTTYMPATLVHYDVSDGSATPLSEMVKTHYGKRYDVSTILESGDDSIFEFSVPTMEKCLSNIANSIEWGQSLEEWLGDEAYELLPYGMEICRIAPPLPTLILSHLVVDGHIPLGEYYIYVDG